jgi:hypothetical protein
MKAEKPRARDNRDGLADALVRISQMMSEEARDLIMSNKPFYS